MEINEALLLLVAFVVAWDYRQPQPLLWAGPDLAPVTLEDERTIEWLAAIRPPVFGPNPGNRAKRRGSNGNDPGQYTRGN